jgi:hypothetical protein
VTRELRAFVLAAAAVTLLVHLAATPPAVAGDDKVRLEIQVTAEGTDEPIANAIIYIKFKEERTLWKDKKREYSVKTNPEGKAVVPIVPEGRVLVQVVVKRWKTYGEFHQLEGPKQVLKIELKRPKRWY